MKKNVFIVLTPDDQQEIREIVEKEDPERALNFIQEKILPQVKKERSCFEVRQRRKRKLL